MKEISVGIDILETKKIERAIKRHGERFLRRVFTQKEREKFPDKNLFIYYALNFSFKESVWKALPQKIQKITYFKDIEIYWDSKKPLLKIKNLSSAYLLNFSKDRKFVLTIAILFMGNEHHGRK